MPTLLMWPLWHRRGPDDQSGALQITDQTKKNMRMQAEAVLRRRGSISESSEITEDGLRLLHELQVHQIELKLQNEELQSALHNVVAIKIDLQSVNSEIRRVNAELEAKNCELAATLSKLTIANDAKSRFLSNMSHEIRTPLTSIIGFADLLETELTHSEPYAKIIKRNAVHLSALVNDVLDLAKIEAEECSLIYSTVKLQDEIDLVIDVLGEKSANKGLDLHFELDKTTPEFVRIDAVRFRQILVNLIGNAVKFTQSGSVKVEVRPGEQNKVEEGESIVFSVTDTGCGIFEESRSGLFERFSQGMSAERGKFGGTGLGLALSRDLARLMGGEIRLSWSKPGVGSCFEFRLRLREKVAAISTRSGVSASSKSVYSDDGDLSSTKILLVEDCKDIRVLFSHFLRSKGAKVDAVETGEDAVKSAQSREYDLILMDLGLPEMSGQETAQKIFESGSSVPIVALTANAMKEEQLACIAQGMRDYCTKPINQNELVRVIKKWTSEPHVAVSH